MKKLITSILLAFTIAAVSFAAPKNIKIDLSQKVDEIVLNYNEWGTIDYSRWQSSDFDITDLFNGKLPEKGDVVNFVWKGKSTKDFNKLHILIADVDENFRWLHLLSEEKRRIPVARNIEAGKDFSFDVNVTLDFSPKTNVKLFFSAGEKDSLEAQGVQKPYDIYGIKLGSHTWQSHVSENVIIWEKGYDNADAGWDFTGIDMSSYDRVRVELESTDAEVWLRLVDKDWKTNFGFNAISKNVFEAKLTGEGSFDKDLTPINPADGFRVYLNQWNNNVPRTEDKKTVIKSIQFLYPGEYVDAGPLGLFGRGFDYEDGCKIQENTVIWPKGTTDAKAGWELKGINLSEYDSVRLTLEKTDTEVRFYITNADGGNWKEARRVDSNTFEMKLTGEGSNSNEPLLDPSYGVRFLIQLWKEKPLKKDMKTIVKSIELIKNAGTINEQFMLEGKELGSSGYRSFVKDNGLIEWDWDKKEKYPSAGWNVSDVDLSAYRGIRIELESTDIPTDIRLIQKDDVDCHIGFDAISPTVLEASFDGSGSNWTWPQGAKWNPDGGIEEIHIRAKNISKKGLKTVIKSVTLISKEEKEVPQPENLVLNGAKLGSRREHAWIGEDFSIRWGKANWAECGWKLEKLEGDIVEIKVSSTDVPLRLRIRESDYKNGASYVDDGSHIFRINLKTKKQINAKGGQKEPEWAETTKAFNFSNGAYICLEPVTGVSKEGKKTVVEYINVVQAK